MVDSNDSRSKRRRYYDYQEEQSPSRRLIQLYAKGGISRVARGICDFTFHRTVETFPQLVNIYEKCGPRKFVFNNTEYKYEYHVYNKTWSNERAVEIPIITEKVKNTDGKILEVGNVLSHYNSVDHKVVDKYEEAENVINKDILDYNPDEKYHLIVSVSTIEHIGWDESPRKPEKCVEALNYLSSLLREDGQLMFTAPLGYNQILDRFLQTNGKDLEEIYWMKRISNKNEWAEFSTVDIEKTEYGRRFNAANEIVIGVIEK